MLRHLTLIAALALVWPAAASAQSLAELAKKTKEEKDEKESSETITTRDLRRAGRSGRGNVSPPSSSTESTPATGDEAGSSEGAEGEEEEKTPEQLREEARSDWSQRLTEAEAEVTRLEGRVAELQQSLTNPGVGTVEQRQRRAADLETAQAELAAARQNVTALQREGRQNGYRR